MNRRLLSAVMLSAVMAFVVIAGCTNKVAKAPVASTTTPTSYYKVYLHWVDDQTTGPYYSDVPQEQFIRDYGGMCDLDVPVFFSFKKDGVRYYYREAYENTPVEVLNRDNLWADMEKAPRAPKELVEEDQRLNAVSPRTSNEEEPRTSIEPDTLKKLNAKSDVQLELPGGHQKVALERFTAWSLEEATFAVRVPASEATGLTPKKSIVTIRIADVPYTGVIDAIQHDDPRGETIVLSIKLKVNRPADKP